MRLVLNSPTDFMRNLYYYVFALLCALYSGHVELSAQEVDMMLYKRDVNGVEIGSTLTKSQILSAFGKPDDYKLYDNGEDGKGESFFYGESRIHFNNGVFDEFYLCTPGFVAFTNHIEGGLKIGDPLSKLDDFKYGKPICQRVGIYHLFAGSDNPVTLIVNKGVIIGILYHDPV